jgi:mannose-6-phosphate isomerase-like protein (cupin superfamily)
MKNMSRRDLCVVLPAFAAIGPGGVQAVASQVHASEFPAPKSPQTAGRTGPANDTPAPPVAGGGTVGAARAIPFDQMTVRTMANGGESRDIAHGTLATGESVNLHQSMQVVGATPNPPHAIQHSEFILVREGELEFQHEAGGQMVSEKVGPGGVIYVAFGTRHALKNVGTVPARYFVVAMGGDAR